METPNNIQSNQIKQQSPYQPKENPMKNSNVFGADNTVKIVSSFLIGAVVGALGVWISGDNDDRKDGDKISKETEKIIVEENKSFESSESVVSSASGIPNRKEPVSVSGNNAIVVLEQSAGDTAEISMVTFSVPGWVAIHEDRDGILGNILGAKRFAQGTHIGEVELLRSMVGGGTYRAVLYQDLGERGFNSSEDAPIKNSEGKIIESFFKVQ